MLRAWIVVLFANLVLGESGSQLGSPNGQYTLSIRHPDGKTLREETVKQVPPGVPEVKGTLNQNFADQGVTLVVIYEAGPNGYVAKYSYKSAGKPEQPVFAIFLSPAVLKSSAG
ncbi:uncharacterized protein LOC115765030 [Drosophila novamexicana]|uniref:uncharacterized protein LOC115765030 n=1 Tax=Drosophila novamexicana TaxID=47314 RepID=UPI0011E58979|nr:uncharacterized protein LOC115765030 [Drosophila novamexicana]